MPATSIFIKAASCGTSGMGNSRISVLLGPVLTAASTLSTTEKTSTNEGLERVSLRSSQQVHLSPQETFAQFPSPFDCRMTPRVIHFERLIRKDCRWLSDWWDS